MFKQQKGITLIALVITIIVLLILAGVTIAMLSGDNGILSRATTTKEANAEAEAREQANLALAAVRTEIAAQKVADGNYNPSMHAGDLWTDVMSKDLKAPKWTVTTAANKTTAGTTSDSIVFEYTDDALKTDGHHLTYTIALDTKTAKMEHSNSKTSPTNPSQGYRQIEEQTN